MNSDVPISMPVNAAGTRQSSGERPLFQIRSRSRDSVKALSLHTTPRKVAKGNSGGNRSGSRSTASRATFQISNGPPRAGSALSCATCGQRSMVRAMVISAPDTINM